jgi:hypothetical protein
MKPTPKPSIDAQIQARDYHIKKVEELAKQIPRLRTWALTDAHWLALAALNQAIANSEIDSSKSLPERFIEAVQGLEKFVPKLFRPELQPPSIPKPPMNALTGEPIGMPASALISMTKQLVTTDDKPPALKGWKAQFVKVLRRTPNVKVACKAAGVHRSTAYDARERDENFAALWDDAISTSIDELEGKVFELAKKGDVNLLTFLLRCHRPQTYNPATRQDVGLLGGVIILPAKQEGAE